MEMVMLFAKIRKRGAGQDWDYIGLDPTLSHIYHRM